MLRNIHVGANCVRPKQEREMDHAMSAETLIRFNGTLADEDADVLRRLCVGMILSLTVAREVFRIKIYLNMDHSYYLFYFFQEYPWRHINKELA